VKRFVCLVFTGFGLAMAVSASASAATVEVVAPGEIAFAAESGEANDLEVEISILSGATFRDRGAPLLAGNGCLALADGVVQCPGPYVPGETGELDVELHMGDLADGARLEDHDGFAGRVSVFGEAGDDRLHVGSSVGFDAVTYGGSGDDTLRSATNFMGAPTHHGGPGDDTIMIAEASGGHAYGGDGNDRLINQSPYFSDGITMNGGAGADTFEIPFVEAPSIAGISGGTGFDTFTAADRFLPVTLDLGTCPNCSLERIIGSPFGDILMGDDGATLFEGGAGDDTIDPGGGKDAVSGDAGADAIDARDRKRDVLHCGSEADVVLADKQDVVAADCEDVSGLPGERHH
jgi:Ca2+-binding RTX toxin-like protein